MFSALEAKENVSNTNKAVVSAICSQIERASKMGLKKIEFATPLCIDKDDVAMLMRNLGYRVWTTDNGVKVSWEI